MSQKATREGVKSHNRRLVLRAVFAGDATSRAAIAQYTGLAKPTISDIVGELIEDEFLVEGGRGESTEGGGKRPRLLHFRSDARQVIGVTINAARIEGALTDLNGEPVVRHQARLDGAREKAALDILSEVINGLIAQLDVPLLCISIGVPGTVRSEDGFVMVSPALGWHDLSLGEYFGELYNVPVFVGNNTELATRALVAFRLNEQARNWVMVLVNSSVEIGIAFGGTAYHHSGDLGLLRVPPESAQLVSYLGWNFVDARIRELRAQNPDTMLSEQPDYLEIRYAYLRGDWLATAIYDELAGHLAHIFAWITGILRPDHITLAGEVEEMGVELVSLVIERASKLMPPDRVDAVTCDLADDPTLSLTGTIAHALHRELGIL